jgi:hypothetical protein
MWPFFFFLYGKKKYNSAVFFQKKIWREKKTRAYFFFLLTTAQKKSVLVFFFSLCVFFKRKKMLQESLCRFEEDMRPKRSLAYEAMQKDGSMQKQFECQQMLLVQTGGKKCNFRTCKLIKRQKKDGSDFGHRPKIYNLLGMTGAQNSTSLCVPPASNPRTTRSRNRTLFQETHKIPIAQSVPRFITNHLQQKEQKVKMEQSMEQNMEQSMEPKSEQKLQKIEQTLSLSDLSNYNDACVLSPVDPSEQYDFLEAEIRMNEDKKQLQPWGTLPQSNGLKGWQPMRGPHLWTYLFKRGFSFTRPGTLHKKKTIYTYTYSIYIQETIQKKIAQNNTEKPPTHKKTNT